MRGSNDNNGFVSILKGTVKGFILAVLAFFVLIAVFAIVISKTDVSDTAVQVMTLVALGTAASCSAFINQRKLRKKGIAVGAISGAEIFLIVFILGLFGDNGAFTLLMLWKLITVMLMGIFGGIASANAKRKYK